MTATGFDESVQLGQLGEILENDSIVMTVELTDQDGQAFQPDHELLWRGVTMAKYEGRRWIRQARPTQAVVSLPTGRRMRTSKLIHQKIKLDPIDSPTLFAIRPATAIVTAVAMAPGSRTRPVSQALKPR